MARSKMNVPITNMPRTKKIFLLTNILIFPIEIAKRLCIYYELESQEKMIIFWSFYLALLILVETIATLVIGIKVLLQLKKIGTINDKINKKVHIFTILIMTITLFLIVELILLGSLIIIESSVEKYFIINWIQSCLSIVIVLAIAATVRPPFVESSSCEGTDSSKSGTIDATRSGRGYSISVSPVNFDNTIDMYPISV